MVLASNRTCQICTKDPAVRFCQCSNPPILFCTVCLSEHQEKNPLSPHQTMPLIALNQGVAEYTRHFNNVSKGKIQLRSSVSMVGQFCEEMSASIDVMIAYLSEWKNSLQQWGMDETQRLSVLVETAVQEAEACLAQGTAPVYPLAMALWNLPAEQLPATRYSVTPADLTKLNQEWCKYECSIQQFCENKPAEIQPEEVKSEPAWECEFCKTANRQENRICTSCCRTRKELLAEGKEVTFWTCKKCGWAANELTQKDCANCKPKNDSDQLLRSNLPKSRPYASSFACEQAERRPQSALPARNLEQTQKGRQRNTPTAEKADGWICSVCQEENYSFSRTCLSCITPKSTESTGKTEARGVDMYPEQERTPPKAGENARSTWRCERCKLDVDSSKSYCGKCYAMKPSLALEREWSGAKVPQGSEKWTCPDCQYVNRPTRSNCLSCKEPRPALEEVKVEKNWVCKRCNRKNPDQKTMCLSCYEQKPAEEQKSAKYDNWTCGRCLTYNIYHDTKCKDCHCPKS